MKTLVWLSSSRMTVRSFPASVRDDVGFALYLAQGGGTSPKAKPLRGYGGGVWEIATNDPSGTYRAVYTVSIGDAIYVLHAFQKKSKVGIATPQAELDIVRRRLQQLRREVKDAEEDSRD